MSELKTDANSVKHYRVIRWRRIVEDTRVSAADRSDAFDVADSNDSWQIIDEQTVDTECETL